MGAYTFQGQEIVAPFRLTSNEPVFSADSINLKTRKIKQGAQRWEMEFTVVMQDPTETFTTAVSTFHDTITFTMPQLNVRGETISSGTCTDNINVKGVEAANDDAIVIEGMTAGSTIEKGRFIKFSNHDKIYMVKQTATADNFGEASLTIYPSLRSALNSSVSLYYRDSDPINFKGYRDISNVQGITYTDGILSDMGTIQLIEAL